MVSMSANPDVADAQTLSLGVSIVLYRTPVAAIEPLLQELLAQGRG